MRLADCHNFTDFRTLAKKRLPSPVFHYIDGAADDEQTYRRNTAAYGDVDLVPSVLNDVETVDLSVSITDANGKVQEVSGDGVVGEQPKLDPGETYRYSSGAVLETPVGAMQGSYRMHADDGGDFDAPIPPFTLAVPGVLH